MDECDGVNVSGELELRERLAQCALPDDVAAQLVEVLTTRLVSHFGAERVECWLGKNGLVKYEMGDVALAAVAHLGDAIDPAEALKIGITPAPWANRWRDDPRTADWRS